MRMLETNLTQGSQEWLDFRKKGIGASDAPIVMGMSPWRSVVDLYKEKLGLIEPQPITSSMQRGMDLEPKARRLFEEMTGILVVPDIKISEKYSWLYASLDGISIDEKVIVEIKCTSKKNHELAKNGKIPSYYMPQIQHQIYVCNVDICHYFSFDGNDGKLVNVPRDNEFISKLLEMEKEFYNCMINSTEPKL